MNVLIFYNYNFGIEDVKECFEKKGYKFKVVWSEQLNQRKCTELDDIFEKEFDEGVGGRAFDCVFTFNYSPVISNNCNKRNVPYISIVYDSPQYYCIHIQLLIRVTMCLYLIKHNIWNLVMKV